MFDAGKLKPCYSFTKNFQSCADCLQLCADMPSLVSTDDEEEDFTEDDDDDEAPELEADLSPSEYTSDSNDSVPELIPHDGPDDSVQDEPEEPPVSVTFNSSNTMNDMLQAMLQPPHLTGAGLDPHDPLAEIDHSIADLDYDDVPALVDFPVDLLNPSAPSGRNTPLNLDQLEALDDLEGDIDETSDLIERMTQVCDCQMLILRAYNCTEGFHFYHAVVGRAAAQFLQLLAERCALSCCSDAAGSCVSDAAVQTPTCVESDCLLLVKYALAILYIWECQHHSVKRACQCTIHFGGDFIACMCYLMYISACEACCCCCCRVSILVQPVHRRVPCSHLPLLRPLKQTEPACPLRSSILAELFSASATTPPLRTPQALCSSSPLVWPW